MNGNEQQQATIARKALGVFDPTGMGAVALRGNDAAEYLHARLTNAVLGLRPGQGRRALLLGGDAWMIARFHLFRIEDEFLALCEPSIAETAYRQLEKYVITEDVEVIDRRAEFAALHAFGPGSIEWAATTELGAEDDEPLSIRRVSVGKGKSVWSARIDLGRIPGRLVFGSSETIESRRASWIQAAEVVGGNAIDAETMNILCVEEGEPRHGLDWDEKTIPLEVNLKRAIDYTKGCYPGQEIIARITNLGHPAQAMVGLKFEADTPPPPGSQLLLDGETVGKVGAAALSPTHGAIGLGRVKWNHRETGIRIEARGGIPATVRELPFREP